MTTKPVGGCFRFNTMNGTLVQKIAALAADPFAPNNNVKKLVNRPECRLRVGDWRVLYAVHEGRLVIEVIRIAPRGGVY